VLSSPTSPIPSPTAIPSQTHTHIAAVCGAVVVEQRLGQPFQLKSHANAPLRAWGGWAVRITPAISGPILAAAPLPPSLSVVQANLTPYCGCMLQRMKMLGAIWRRS
jgi:hypothetical protein